MDGIWGTTWGGLVGLEALFLLVPVFIAGVFLLVALTALLRGINYARSPRLTSPAVCVSRRTEVRGGMGDSASRTNYHATFELPDGQRVELGMSGRDYGQLAEGDRGTLQWQYRSFKGFARDLPVTTAQRQVGGTVA